MGFSGGQINHSGSPKWWRIPGVPSSVCGAAAFCQDVFKGPHAAFLPANIRYVWSLSCPSSEHLERFFRRREYLRIEMCLKYSDIDTSGCFLRFLDLVQFRIQRCKTFKRYIPSLACMLCIHYTGIFHAKFSK